MTQAMSFASHQNEYLIDLIILMGCSNSSKGDLKYKSTVREIACARLTTITCLPNWKSIVIEHVSSIQNHWKLIHLVSYIGNIQVLSELLDNGEDANSPDCVRTTQHCDTPLHLAVLQSHFDVVRLLLAHGADPQASNNVVPRQISETPSCLSTNLEDSSIKELLESQTGIIWNSPVVINIQKNHVGSRVSQDITIIDK